MLTNEDIDLIIDIVKHTDPGEGEEEQFKRVEDGLEKLKKLWTKEGLPVNEVSIFLNSQDREIHGPNQIHSYNVGDEYSEEDFRGTISELRAYAVEPNRTGDDTE